MSNSLCDHRTCRLFKCKYMRRYERDLLACTVVFQFAMSGITCNLKTFKFALAKPAS